MIYSFITSTEMADFTYCVANLTPFLAKQHVQTPWCLLLIPFTHLNRSYGPLNLLEQTYTHDDPRVAAFFTQWVCDLTQWAAPVFLPHVMSSSDVWLQQQLTYIQTYSYEAWLFEYQQYAQSKVLTNNNLHDAIKSMWDFHMDPVVLQEISLH